MATKSISKKTPKSDAKKNYTKAEQATILKELSICWSSREASILARREVLTGKAKFGIIGDGKELPQIALSKFFKQGDWRSGYYRDQTWMMALGVTTMEAFFAQLYADAVNDPFSGGRQMNCHFATPMVDQNGDWVSQLDQYNVASDISPTAGQMGRAVGLALASKKYRQLGATLNNTKFSKNGDEVVFVSIGDASTSEGAFWESMNAAAVQQIPMIVSVWDDGYGISVPIEYQTTKGSISEALAGFGSSKDGEGMDIYCVKAWDYEGLVATYEAAVKKTRKTHKPCLIHVQEATQQQGHSTSGSHERYKSKARLQWEKEHDCNMHFGNWIIEQGIATAEEVEAIKTAAIKETRAAKNRAYQAFITPVQEELKTLAALYAKLQVAHPELDVLRESHEKLLALLSPLLNEVIANARQCLLKLKGYSSEHLDELRAWVTNWQSIGQERYSTNFYASGDHSALNVPIIAPVYTDDSPQKNAYEILNTFFDQKLASIPELLAFGEDVGKIGGVNQGFMGMQDKHGEDRVFDTGIREWTIIGQAIGLAMRGLKPISEIQYLDYLLYALSPLSDDLCTLRYRTNGLQQSPAIIRTRGHRLEGIWHAGSPIGMMLHSLRGMFILTPRDGVQAAGMYNTILQSKDPAILVECLNGYRLKETLPDNISEMTVPLGVPEVLETGTDVTVVTYGTCVRIAQDAIDQLKELGVSVELIDVQTMLPFDLEHRIVESLKKTNRILFLDEDVPGGASAYMMQKVLEEQSGYQYLDSKPITLSAKAHRPPFGSDGDYFSKPNAEDVVEAVLNLMNEAEPYRFVR